MSITGSLHKTKLAGTLKRQLSEVETKGVNLRLSWGDIKETRERWKSYLSVASELVESVWTERDGDEGHVRVVHGLELDAGVRAIPCGLVQQVLQWLQNLLEEVALNKPCFKHDEKCFKSS
jgi:hypothetical protein